MNNSRAKLFAYGMSLALIFSAFGASVSSLRAFAQGQRRRPTQPRTSVVQITLHADLKETFMMSKDTVAESGKAKAELTMIQDYTGKRQMTPYPDGSAEFLEIPNSPGSMSGSFHFQGEDEGSTKGPDRLWDSHKVEVAGSLKPLGGVDQLQNMVFRVGTGSGDELATCETKGNMHENPHECGAFSVSEVTVQENGRCNGPCGSFSFSYELHPSGDRPTQQVAAASDFNTLEWYGATTSGGNSTGYDIEFDGKKFYETNGVADDPSYKDSHEKHLHVSIKITRAGAVGFLPKLPCSECVMSAAAVLETHPAALAKKYII